MKEYEILHSKAKEYDARLFQIKGWSISLFSASIGLAIAREQSLLLVIPLITSFLFWGMDSLYKSFQHIVILRTLEVESIFSGVTGSVETPIISHRFSDRDKTLLGRLRRVGDELLGFNVAVLYVAQLLVLTAIGLYLAN